MKKKMKFERKKRLKPNRKHKDTVFVDLFARDERAEQNFRSLYNAVSESSLPDNAKLEPIVVENVLYTNMVNDVSYLVDGSEIFLAEHQSTVNENMPMRFYLYLARLFCYLLESENLYKRDSPETPTPAFYVFYNGREDYPLEKTLEISTGFKKRKKKFKLELTVEVININPHKGHEVLEKCKPLREYSLFVEAVRKHTEQNPEKGFDRAIKECIDNNILKDYLLRKSKEVRNMIAAEYDYELDMAVQRKEARQQGIKQGMQKKQENIVLNMVSKGFDMQTISECTELSQKEIHEITKKIK